ncbi:MAG: Flp family type IVb pilin [Bacillota bacterium]|nr:Flp family type IVb pilin [Bacillota bacterium]
MMTLIRNYLRRWFKDEEAQTLTEYALILVLIAIVAITALTGLGARIVVIFQNILAGLQAPAP